VFFHFESGLRDRLTLYPFRKLARSAGSTVDSADPTLTETRRQKPFKK
jgi:hypothetical protein